MNNISLFSFFFFQLQSLRGTVSRIQKPLQHRALWTLYNGRHKESALHAGSASTKKKKKINKVNLSLPLVTIWSRRFRLASRLLSAAESPSCAGTGNGQNCMAEWVMRTGMGWMDGWMDEWMVPDTGGISYVQVDRSVNKYLWSSSVKTNKTRTHHSSSGSNLASPLRNRNGARHGRRSALCKWRDGWASLLQKWILSWDNMPEQWYVGRCWGLLTRKKKKKRKKKQKLQHRVFPCGPPP